MCLYSSVPGSDLYILCDILSHSLSVDSIKIRLLTDRLSTLLSRNKYTCTESYQIHIISRGCSKTRSGFVLWWLLSTNSGSWNCMKKSCWNHFVFHYVSNIGCLGLLISTGSVIDFWLNHRCWGSILFTNTSCFTTDKMSNTIFTQDQLQLP